MNSPVLLTSSFPDPIMLKNDIAINGFKIYDNAIDRNALIDMKNFWSVYFSAACSKQRVIRGNMRLGEKFL